MEKEIICTTCPKGCEIKVKTYDGEICEIKGFACVKGRRYAVAECTNPIRTITGVVRIANRDYTMLSVKTAKPVPKKNIFDVCSAINAISVDAPIYIGDIIATDVCGADIVSTKTVL